MARVGQGIVVSALAVGPAAYAQEPDLAELPETPATQPHTPQDPLAPSVPPVTSSARDERRPGPWAVSLRAREAWDANPRFVTSEDEGTLVSVLAAGLARNVRWKHGRLDFGAEAGTQRYRQTTALDQWSYAFNGSGSWRPGRATELRVAAGHASTYSRDDQVLGEAGLLLPQVVVKRTNAELRLSRQLSAFGSGIVYVRQQRMHFDSTLLTDGNELALGGSVVRRLGAAHSAALSYAFQSGSGAGLGGDGKRSEVHSLYGVWNSVLSRRVSGGISLGLISFPSSGAAGRQLTPLAGAALSFADRRDSAAARYTRSASQAFGFGRERIAELIAVSYTRNLGRVVAAQASYGRGLTHDPSDPSFRFTTDSYAVDVRWQVAKTFCAVGGYSFRRREPAAPALPFSGSLWSLSVAYDRELP
jgi:hypothetical protein